MSVANWFRRHRRQLAAHSLIFVGFGLLLAVGAEPLFDRLERVPGEAQLQRLRVPAETGGIQYWIDLVEITEHLVEVRGWAFIEDHDSVDSETYMVLESADRTYVFDTQTEVRPRVTQHFRELGLDLDLDQSGFIAFIPTRRIADGEYTIGIYIRKGGIEALQYVDEGIAKYRGSVKSGDRTAALQDMESPEESGNIEYSIDGLGRTAMGETQITQVRGWAFIEGLSAEDSVIYVVLKSETATYVFDTILQRRPDVTAHFEDLGLDLDNSGFVAWIAADVIEEGRYRLGIYVRQGDIEALQYTDRTVEF